MSLLWPASEQEIVISEPRLHALVIGVADYPHLGGGTGAPARNPLGLSQVSTPRPTAIEIIKWLYTSYNNSDCKLGSLEALISPSSTIDAIPNCPNGETATMQAIESSFQ